MSLSLPQRHHHIIVIGMSILFVVFVFMSIFRMGLVFWFYDRVFDWVSARLSFDYYLAQFTALSLTAIFSATFPYLFWTFFTGRYQLHTTIAIITASGVMCIMIYTVGSDVYFDRQTGQPLKWCADTPDGKVCSNSPGYDKKFGIRLRPFTTENARILDRQKKGIQPARIYSDPARIEFFDRLTGHPKIWYSLRPDGKIELFNAEGFTPTDGSLLLPITNKIILQVLAQNEKEHHEQIEAERRAEAERSKRDSRLKRDEIIGLFGFQNYSRDSIVVGFQGKAGDVLSAGAADRLRTGILDRLRNRGFIAEDLAPSVYSSRHFDELVVGNIDVLSKADVSKKIKELIVGNVTKSCHQSLAISGITSCYVNVNYRVISPGNGSSVMRELSEVGAGSSDEDAISRAVDMISSKLNL